MITTEARKFATLIVKGLLEKKAISPEVVTYQSGGWSVVQPLFGLEMNQTYTSDKIAEKIVDDGANHFDRLQKTA